MDRIQKNPPTTSPENSGIEKKKEGELLNHIDSFSLLEIRFPADKMPKVLNALIIKEQNSFEDYTYVIGEVQEILQYNRVLAVAVFSEGDLRTGIHRKKEMNLKRGMKVLDTGAPLSAIRGREEKFEGFTMYIEQVTNFHPPFVNQHKAVTPMAGRVTVVLLLAYFFIKFF